MECIYCKGPGPFTDEHVLTRAFAGQGENLTLVDTVCHNCNTILFSQCEREWTSFPGLATARIYYGPVGRKRKGRSYRVHPGEHIYLVAEGDPIAYEAEVLEGLKPQVRAQVISCPDRLLELASDTNAARRLQNAMDEFVRQRDLTVYKHPDLARPRRYLIARLGRIPSWAIPTVVGYEWQERPTNAWLDRFPDRPPREPFFCRASVDQDDRLRIRAENVETAVVSFRRILNEPPSGEGEGGSFDRGRYEIAFGHEVNLDAVNRALAKTAFNLAVHVLGYSTMRDSRFDPCRRYCCTGEGDELRHPFVGWLTERQQLATLHPIFGIQDPTRHLLLLASDGQRLCMSHPTVRWFCFSCAYW